MRRASLTFMTMVVTLLLASGVARADVVTGTEEPDYLVGAFGGDSVYGLGAGDILADDPADSGPGADDSLYGGAGGDGVYAETGDDFISGGADGDELSGGVGSDLVLGEDGDDFVDGGPPFDAFGDRLDGGAGNDKIDAYESPAAADFVYCGSGDDIVYTDGADLIADDCETVVLGPNPDSDDLLYAAVSSADGRAELAESTE